jgi:hypothetical protein
MIVQDGDQWAADDKQTEAERELVRTLAGAVDGAAQCRRAVLDGYLDRQEEARVGCEEGEEKCDVCRGSGGSEEESEAETETEAEQSDSSAEADVEEMDVEGTEWEAGREERQQAFAQQELQRQGPRQTLLQRRQEEFADVEWLCRQLAYWANRCGLCKAEGDAHSGHSVQQCWRAESTTIKQTVEEWDKGIVFDK